jgi:acetyl esterase/lipase
VAILIHGGFWRARYDCSLMNPMAADLAARGIGVWNVEYRRVGTNGGDPAVTTADVADAVDLLASFVPAESAPTVAESGLPTVVVGHSAGGQLATWVGGRDDQPIVPALVISQAGVLDLEAAAVDRLGNGAVQDFLGGEPGEVPDRYRAATPVLHAGRTHCVHGVDDDTVPLSQSTDARDRDGTVLPVTVVAADHMQVIDPDHPAWRPQLELIQAELARPSP